VTVPFYARWRPGTSRVIGGLNPLPIDHIAYCQPCSLCTAPLGDGLPIALYVIGPDGPEDRERHDRGQVYSARAAAVHARCAERLANEIDASKEKRDHTRQHRS